jgi:hypothetical protein
LKPSSVLFAICSLVLLQHGCSSDDGSVAGDLKGTSGGPAECGSGGGTGDGGPGGSLAIPVGDSASGECSWPANDLCLPCHDNDDCTEWYPGGKARCKAIFENLRVCVRPCDASAFSTCPQGTTCQSLLRGDGLVHDLCIPLPELCPCVPDCTCDDKCSSGSPDKLRECGPDGCGGECGGCGEGECDNGFCIHIDPPPEDYGVKDAGQND